MIRFSKRNRAVGILADFAAVGAGTSRMEIPTEEVYTPTCWPASGFCSRAGSNKVKWLSYRRALRQGCQKEDGMGPIAMRFYPSLFKRDRTGKIRAPWCSKSKLLVRAGLAS
jgi:hypothetical protein